MDRLERSGIVRDACARDWRDNRADTMDAFRDGYRLEFYQQPDYIRDAGGQVVGVDAWVRLFGPDGREVRIDPHRRIVNPPTIHEGDTNPVAAFRDAVWDSVLGAPNPRGWRTRGTVTTVFSDAADGRCFSENATYATARAGGGTLTVSTTGTNHSIGQLHDGTNYNCIQGFVSFDTSAITDTDAVSAIVLDLWLVSDSSTGAEFICEVRDFDWGATVTTADYTPGANLGNFTLVSSIDTTSIGATGAYKTLTSETAFKTVTNIKTGVVHLMMSSSRQRLNNAPGTSTQEFVNWSFADEAGTTQDPKLTITHAAPVISPPFQRKPYRVWRRS